MAKINISDLTVSRSQLEKLSEQELAGIGGGSKTDQELALDALKEFFRYLLSSRKTK